MMATPDMDNILMRIKEEATIAPPGILPKGKSMDSYIGHTVINLSDTTLTEAQVSALEKGLTFCPTPGPPNKSLIWTDFKEFHRRLCLKFHFYNDNQMFDHLSENELDLINFMASNLDQEIDPYKNLHKGFVNKSTWKPNRVHQSLDIFQRSFKLGLLNIKTKYNSKSNLSKEQRLGLKQLADNPEIIIKKADKGSAVVVMNTTDYLREGYRQLSDIKYYTKLPNDPTDTIADNVTKTLTQMRHKGLITEKNFEHLNPDNCTEARFYMLPKIHKKGVPDRPICSSVNHPTSRISKLVDEHIKEYVPQTKSYIRDTFY